MTAAHPRDEPPDEANPMVGTREAVLLVEDDRVSRLVVERALRQDGHEVTTATNGAQAQTLLAQHRFSAIVTDLYMPEIDGMALLRHVRALDPNSQVILLTDLASAQTAAEALRYDAFDYISKPIQDLKQLLRVVENAIALKHALDERDRRARYLDALSSTANIAVMATSPDQLVKRMCTLISGVLKAEVVAIVMQSPVTKHHHPSNAAELSASPAFHLHASERANWGTVASTTSQLQESLRGGLLPGATEMLQGAIDARLEELSTRLSGSAPDSSSSGPEAALLLPVSTDDQSPSFGIIAVGPRILSPFSSGEIQTLDGIAGHLAMVMKRLNMERSLTRREQTVAGIETENARLRELSDLKDHLLTTASHELRTPLNAILGFAQVLRDQIDGPLTKAQAHDVERIQHNAVNLINVVDDILDLKRIEQGSLRVKASLCDLVSLVTDCLQTAEAMPRNPAVALKGPAFSEGQGFLLFTDAAKVRRILLNLLSNAVRFTQSGEIRVELSQPSAKMTDILVTDTGPGIPEGQRELIFERFWQAKRLDTETAQGPTAIKSKDGVGIGLNLSRDLATLLGGSLELVKLDAPGACFRLRLSKWK